MNVTRKKTFSIKDWTGVTISVIALSFSALTYYYSNLYVRDEMLARFVEIPALNENAQGIYDADLRVIFMNTGNKAGVVLSVGYRLGKTADGTGFGVDFDTDSIPFILKPDQIKFVHVHIPGQNISYNFASGDTALTADSPAVMASSFYLTANINSLDSKGEEFKSVSIPIAIIVAARKKGIIAISPIGNVEHRSAITMPLYRNGQPPPPTISIK